MSTNVVNARKAYFDKFRYLSFRMTRELYILLPDGQSLNFSFRSLIGFELDDDMKDVEDRLLKWSEQRLRHEGIALFRLAGKLTVRSFFSGKTTEASSKFHLRDRCMTTLSSRFRIKILPWTYPSTA